MTKPRNLPTAAEKAEATIQFFEQQGREVSSVSIQGTKIELTFSKPEEPTPPGVDLVRMSR